MSHSIRNNIYYQLLLAAILLSLFDYALYSAGLKTLSNGYSLQWYSLVGDPQVGVKRYFFFLVAPILGLGFAGKLFSQVFLGNISEKFNTLPSLQEIIVKILTLIVCALALLLSALALRTFL